MHACTTIQQLSTAHDHDGTRKLRALILENPTLSSHLAEAVAKVFAAHGFTPAADQIVALEPVVTRRIPEQTINSLAEGSRLREVTGSLSVGIHVVETRALVSNYAITSSAWNG